MSASGNRPGWPDLVELNLQGAGIFVTVNATDGRGRKKENIARIRAVWQEDDVGNAPALPCEPHSEQFPIVGGRLAQNFGWRKPGQTIREFLGLFCLDLRSTNQICSKGDLNLVLFCQSEHRIETDSRSLLFGNLVRVPMLWSDLTGHFAKVVKLPSEVRYGKRENTTQVYA